MVGVVDGGQTQRFVEVLEAELADIARQRHELDVREKQVRAILSKHGLASPAMGRPPVRSLLLRVVGQHPGITVHDAIARVLAMAESEAGNPRKSIRETLRQLRKSGSIVRRSDGGLSLTKTSRS